MSLLDAAIVLILVLYAVRGIRRGFVFGIVDLAGLLFILVVGFAGARGLGAILAQSDLLRPEIAQFAAFCILVVVASALYSLISYSFLAALMPTAGRRRTRGYTLSRVLGVVPGLIEGAVMALLLVVAVGLLPLAGSGTPLGQDSRLAPQLRALSSRVGVRSEGLLPLTPRPLLRVEAPGTGDPPALSFPPDLALRNDVSAEDQMLALVNADRRREGLRPLVMDRRLQAVARAHSRDMFRDSYFAHESPTTGSPFDRLRRADIVFLTAGENLAYQRDVRTAHRELMRSPGHRRNLLSPLYNRVGIGIVRGGLYGLMISQEFTD